MTPDQIKEGGKYIDKYDRVCFVQEIYRYGSTKHVRFKILPNEALGNWHLKEFAKMMRGEYKE